MTAAIVNLLLIWHIALLPVFKPTISGIHDGHLNISNGPDWSNDFHARKLQQPGGTILIWRGKW